MRRAWLVVPIGGLVALPVHVLPVRPIVWLVTSAGLLCVAGVLARSPALVGAGSGAAVLAYALALWIAAPPPDLLGAVAFGLALCLTLEGSHFAARLHGATVSRARRPCRRGDLYRPRMGIPRHRSRRRARRPGRGPCPAHGPAAHLTGPPPPGWYHL